jgi:isoquinoline 1-oxidoreductase beta subunit
MFENRISAFSMTALIASSTDAAASGCGSDLGRLYHAPTGRRVANRELADKAAALRVPDRVALKDPKDFKLIGTAKRRA